MCRVDVKPYTIAPHSLCQPYSAYRFSGLVRRKSILVCTSAYDLVMHTAPGLKMQDLTIILRTKFAGCGNEGPVYDACARLRRTHDCLTHIRSYSLTHSDYSTHIAERNPPRKF